MYIYFEELDENKGTAKFEYNETDGRGHSLDFIDLLWKESSII